MCTMCMGGFHAWRYTAAFHKLCSEGCISKGMLEAGGTPQVAVWYKHDKMLEGRSSSSHVVPIA